MTDLETVRACLAQIRPAALNYEEWLATGMVGKEAGLPFSEWDAWSRGDKRYKPGEMLAKWNSFRGSSTHPVGLGSLVKLCRDQGGTIESTPAAGEGHELAWDATIGPNDGTPAERPALQVVRQEWLQDLPLPPEPNGDWDGRADLAAYIRTLFNSDERVCYVTESWEQDSPDGSKRFLPRKGVADRTAGELLETLAIAKDLGEVIGDWNSLAGAWIRFNPLDGQGVSDSNVTALRFALVESDDISIERQHAIYQQMELPIAALVHSGSRSLHAIVRIDAPNFAEYQKRVDFLYDCCKRNGLVIDRKNRNPSRLSRLPGATRNGKRQWLVATNIGKATWGEWADWIAASNDDLPEVECLATYLHNRPPLADVLIEGILRRGHKLLLTGPANAGKSMLLIHLAIAISEGRRWLRWQCGKGRVLLVNLEVDRASCYHKIGAVYDALGIPGDRACDIDVWNLRGQALPMADLAPRLIRRAAKGNYAAIIVDPIYKVQWGDENSAGDVARFCSQFDRICRELGCAAIYCHHHSKGAQGAKYAADRASGSGVFKRDPDALLDMTELMIDDARRAQVSQQWECAAMARMLDAQLPGWREECSQDTAIVANHLAEWAIAKVGVDPIAAVRAPAITAAQLASGWRLECGTVREFAKFDPVRVWFRFPLHTTDANVLLADALADGEEPAYKRKPKEAGEAKAQRTDTQTLNAIVACKDERGLVTMESLVEYLDLDRSTVCKRLKKVAHAVVNGLVEPEEKGE